MFGNLFNLDSPLSRFLDKVTDFMILNLLFLACSVPIVTIGASITALYDVLTKMDTNREVPAAKGFLKAFKSNFVKSTKLWFVFLVVTVFLAMDVYIVGYGLMLSPNVRMLLLVLFFVALFFWIMAGGYMFVLQARIENSVGRTVKVACVFAYAHLIPYSIATGIIHLLPIIMLLIFTETFYTALPIWIFGGITLLAYVNSKVYMGVLIKYVPELRNVKEEYKPLEFNEEDDVRG